MRISKECNTLPSSVFPDNNIVNIPSCSIRWECDQTVMIRKIKLLTFFKLLFILRNLYDIFIVIDYNWVIYHCNRHPSIDNDVTYLRYSNFNGSCKYSQISHKSDFLRSPHLKKNSFQYIISCQYLLLSTKLRTRNVINANRCRFVGRGPGSDDLTSSRGLNTNLLWQGDMWWFLM